MSDLRILYAQHREILDLAHQVVAMLERPRRPSPSELTELRWTLATAVSTHLAHEEALVMVPLINSDDATLHMLGVRYAEDLLDSRLSTSVHSGKWNMPNICADWAGYTESVHAQVAEIERRIAWEEREIFPHARGLAPIRQISISRAA